MKLVKLTPQMEREFQSYINEWREAGETVVPWSSDPQDRAFSDYLQTQRAFETEEGCPEHFVPGTTWFYVDDAGRIFGAVNLRHRLNDFLLRTGGHIGYGVRPSERRKGYAAQMLALALERANEMGIPRVLVTCDKENLGSARTILKNGGVLENEVPEEDRITQRYWIETGFLTKTVPLKDGQSLVIRRAEESDAQAMIDFLNTVGGESNFLLFEKNGCTNTPEREKAWIRNQDQPNSIFLVGCINGEIAATAQIGAAQRKRIAHTGEFSIAVRKRFWHSGVATAMITELLDYVRNCTQLEIIHLGVNARNIRAVRLYQKFGFAEIGRFPKFFKINENYDDEILMNLYL